MQTITNNDKCRPCPQCGTISAGDVLREEVTRNLYTLGDGVQQLLKYRSFNCEYYPGINHNYYIQDYGIKSNKHESCTTPIP